MRYFLKIAFLIILTFYLSGCAELSRKFTRKNPHKKETVSFYSVEEYKTKSPAERYRDHYVYWRNWHLDLERTDGSGFKRDMTAMDETLRHLTAMRDLLADEKAQGLTERINDLETIRDKMKRRRHDVMKDPHVRKIIERSGRVIVNNFSYNAVKEFLINEDVDGAVKESEVKESL